MIEYQQLYGWADAVFYENPGRRVAPEAHFAATDRTPAGRLGDPAQLASLADRLREHVDGLDGVVHSIAFAPQGALGGNFLHTSWDDVATCLRVSTYSYQALAAATLPLMREGGAFVGLDYDASRTWTGYDWMGVAKAGLESCSRYLARELGPRGIRVNLVAAGPLRTTAATSVPGFDEKEFDRTAPLGWRGDDFEPTARACAALLSDWFPATSGRSSTSTGARMPSAAETRASDGRTRRGRACP
ncbi:SDR family oxidoreductase [Streptomyces sp. NPDC006645]|uniref:SDR family oxidoreductase n=1 Tax=unclassified Streptomyces TaxID=2593676 RepID=UPI0033A8604C